MPPKKAPDLRGRAAFITGPTRGIGAEVARQLSKKGVKLALAGLEPEKLKDLAAELGPDVEWWETDVRDPAQVDAAVKGAVERFGAIDVVMANAGIYRMTPLATSDAAEAEKVIDVNLLGAWRTVHAALPHVVERRGYVLVLASLAAVLHLPLMAAYAASKAGVTAMANALRMELEGTGTKVGVAYFGIIDTDMTHNAWREPLIGRVRSRERGVLTAPPLPVEVAARAIVRGIERRSRWVLEPKWAAPALLAPWFVQRLAEAESRRQGIARLIRSETELR
jgi:NAD(P)-dependent dehydrogenase (short-subunit alcohol dehydrogenase family)